MLSRVWNGEHGAWAAPRSTVAHDVFATFTPTGHGPVLPLAGTVAFMAVLTGADRVNVSQARHG